MRKYVNYQDFEAVNRQKMDVIRGAARLLKSPEQLATSGNLLGEADKLCHFYLMLVHECSDLMEGLTASVLDAQTLANAHEGLTYALKEGNATERNRQVACDREYISLTSCFNDLTDLKKYLDLKREDFTSSHYYYKNLATPQK